MTDDIKRKPPPRPPYVRPVEPPSEPFRKLTEEREKKQHDIGEVLTIQRKMALQLDGFGQLINRRFDLFHQEIALQRADLSDLTELVKGNHGPRIEKVEKKTAAQKAKAGAAIAARFGAWGTGALFFGGLALRALAKIYPQYGDLIEGILGAVGL